MNALGDIEKNFWKTKYQIVRFSLIKNFFFYKLQDKLSKIIFFCF